MKVFTIINGYTGALCLSELVRQGHEVVGVVTSPPGGPARAPEETVVGVAAKHLLPVYMPPAEVVAQPEGEFVELVRRARPDLLVSMHYGAIFKPALLGIPRLGAVNIHPSKLPEGRGMTPSYWYLYLGRETAWTALHYLDAGVDSGDVIAFGSTLITHEDAGASVARRLSEAAAGVFGECLPAIMAGTAPRRKQNLKRGSYLWASFDWSALDWTREAAGIRGHVRCFTGTAKPVQTFVSGVALTVNDAEVVEATETSARPGEVLDLTAEGVLVQAGRGRVVLTDFAVEGSRREALRVISAARPPVVLGGAAGDR